VLLYKIIGPEVTATPEAPAAARRALAALGPLRRDEIIVLLTFVGMVALWAAASTLGLDSTAIAFLGLGTLLATGAMTLATFERGRRARHVHLVRGTLHAEHATERDWDSWGFSGSGSGPG
jgi:di/tricarboxylate transporter